MLDTGYLELPRGIKLSQLSQLSQLRVTSSKSRGLSAAETSALRAAYEAIISRLLGKESMEKLGRIGRQSERALLTGQHGALAPRADEHHVLLHPRERLEVLQRLRQQSKTNTSSASR